MSHELEPSIYQEDWDGEKKFKSKRYPDMHGALSNASATPDQRLEMQGVEDPKSEVVMDKVSRQRTEFIHGRHGPSASLPVLVNLLNTQIETLKTLKEIQQLLEFKVPIGQTKAFSLSYDLKPATGSPTPGFTHIEFVDSQFTMGVPNNQLVNEPQRKLYRIKIINDGSLDIQFSLNVPRSDRSAEVTLHSGEYDEVDFVYPIIWSLNIALIPGSNGTKTDARVRVFYAY